MPATLKRSPKKAQDTYEETLEHAEQEYKGDEARAHRTAFASLKHSFEKVGDHWEPKDHKGPSDPEAEQKGDPAKHPSKKTFGGVDYNGHTKQELYERAKSLGIAGRSKMDKEELAEHIARKQK
jgi:cation transport regulator ChaB